MLVPRCLTLTCKGNAVQPSRTLQELYESEIDFKRLEAQLAILPDILKTVNLQCASQGQVVITQVTSISTVCVMINSSSFGKSMFSSTHLSDCAHDIRICRKRIINAKKTKNLSSCYHVTKPSQSLHTHIDYTANLLNITDIPQEFVACNERRQSFFGSY